jgi:hypothetical protein
MNLDQRLIQLSAMDRSIYTIQWVEMGLERDLEDIGEDAFQCKRAVYNEGAKRWFTLFYNSATNKFIEYFEKLILSEHRSQLRFPADILDGSYSTAFASGITPQDLVVPLLGNEIGPSDGQTSLKQEF